MLVSIYLPTRNRVGLLSRAAESALDQTHTNFELIIVDDASSDGTRDYLKLLQDNDSRVRVLRNDAPSGASRARNQAIRAARGDFVTGLDDDDSFYPHRVATLLARWHQLSAEGRRVSCLFSQDRVVRSPETSYSQKPDVVAADDLFFYNLIGNQIFTRRDYLVQAGLYDEQIPAWQDLDVFIRLLRQFGHAVLVDEPLYTLNLDPRPDRISMGAKSKILSAYRQICSKNARLPSAMRQGLFLQVFGRLYGFGMEYQDLKEFLSYGVHLRTLKSLIGIYCRRATTMNRLVRQ